MSAHPDEEPTGRRDPELVALVARQRGDHAALAERVSDLEDRVEEFASALDDVEEHFSLVPGPIPDDRTDGAGDGDLPAPPDAAAPDSDVEIGLDMRRLVTWVRDNVALLLERKVPQTGGYPYWCRKWWLHPEAIARFEAARRSWAEAVIAGDGNAMVVYFEHLDHQLGVLCSENGPFCGCKGGMHSTGSGATPLGHDEPHESYFLDYEAIETGHSPA
ncbi:DUF4913 domain-containing protein [Pseudonocardia xishanensis]|uniref:DUF4913 domain-containing protein n=1 Tax=Pseudonocardia xishanensis TaxID=630995 RepID=A0ABP8RZT6_9PSEU